MNTAKFKQLVEGLMQENLNQAQDQASGKNPVDTKSELQKYLKDLSMKVPQFQGADGKEIENFSALIDNIAQDLQKGSLSATLKQVLQVYSNRTKNLP